MGGSGEGSDGVADLPPLEEAEAARGGRRVRGREGAEADDSFSEYAFAGLHKKQQLLARKQEKKNQGLQVCTQAQPSAVIHIFSFSPQQIKCEKFHHELSLPLFLFHHRELTAISNGQWPPEME